MPDETYNPTPLKHVKKAITAHIQSVAEVSFTTTDDREVLFNVVIMYAQRPSDLVRSYLLYIQEGGVNRWETWRYN